MPHLIWHLSISSKGWDFITWSVYFKTFIFHCYIEVSWTNSNANATITVEISFLKRSKLEEPIHSELTAIHCLKQTCCQGNPQDQATKENYILILHITLNKLLSIFKTNKVLLEPLPTAREYACSILKIEMGIYFQKNYIKCLGLLNSLHFVISMPTVLISN